MSNRIKIRIVGKGAGTDAPTVDDLSEQLSGYFDLMGIVEQTLAEDGQLAIEWRVVHAATASPITFTVEAFSRQFGVNVDRRAGHVVTHTAEGIRQLQQSAERPRYFTDQALGKAQRLFERLSNGLDRTQIDVEGEAAPIDITPSAARAGAQNVRAILQPTFKPYREIGSVEGYFQSVSQDGHGRRVLNMRSRLTGDEVKCLVSGNAEKELAHCEIGDVWGLSGVFLYSA